MFTIPAWYLDAKPCPKCGETHRRCGDHTTREGEKVPCMGVVAPGQWRCSRHASATEKAERVDVEQMIKDYAPIGALMKKCAVSTRGRSYVESLEDALHRANTNVMLLGLLIETLPAKAKATETIVAEGTPREAVVYTTIQDGMVGPNHDGDLAVHPYMVMYREWTQTQGQLSKLAADLGLIERQVEIQEVQVRMVAATLSAILSDLQIDLSDPRTRSIIETHLLKMETATVELGTGMTGAVTSS